MFGIYRTLLAACVLFGHLSGLPVFAGYAVFGFYILSGYLMTTIMHRDYGYRAQGRRVFLFNRALRLYPVYWCILALTVGVILWVGQGQAAAYSEYLQVPSSPRGWLMNLSMIYPDYLPFESSPRLAPATWALTVELSYYLLICFGATRTRGRTWGLIALGVAYVVGTLMAGKPHTFRYHPIPAGAVPFGLGGLLYFERERLNRILPKRLGLLSLSALWIGFGVGVIYVPPYLQPCSKDVRLLCFYLNFVLQLLILARLSCLKWSARWATLDKLVGGWSYPIYCMHFTVGLVVSMLVFGEPIIGVASWQTFAIGVLTLVVSIVVAEGLNRLVDEPVQALRRRLKRSAAREERVVEESVTCV